MPRMREPWPWQALALLLLLLTTTVDAISTSSTSASSTSSSTTTSKSNWLALRRGNSSTSSSDTLEITWLANVTEAKPSLLVNLPSTTSTSDWAVTEWKDSLEQLSTIISQTLLSDGDMISLELYFRSADTNVQTITFERSILWQYGPMLVFGNDSLAGLTSLTQLNLGMFNVSMSESGWLADEANLEDLVFDDCNIMGFHVEDSANISNAVFRNTNLTEFPLALLSLDTLQSLTFDSCVFDTSIMMTSEQIQSLKKITNFSFTDNTVPSSTCSYSSIYGNASICVSGDDNSSRSDASATSLGDSSGEQAYGSSAASTGSSSKLASTMIIVVCVAGLVAAIVGFAVFRKKRNSTMLAMVESTSNQDDLLLTRKSQSSLVSADVERGLYDLGKEQVVMDKKIGIHGLWRGNYGNEKIVALRLNQKDLGISSKTLNDLVDSCLPLKHPNVVRLIGTSTIPVGDILIVVEQMDKGTLRSVLKNQEIDLSWPKRLRMSSDVAQALQFVHAHSESAEKKYLTTKTVLCNSDLTCKLDIFDYAKSLRDDTAPILSFGERDIASRAPEVLKGGPLTTPAQVYALGVIFCEISRRQMLYEDIIAERGPTLGDIFIAQEVAAGRLKPTPSEDTPSEFRGLIASCVAYDPAHRPSLQEIVRFFQL